MSIQILRQSASAPLPDTGRPATPIGPPPQLRGTDFALPVNTAEAGLWECEPGSFRCQVKNAEVMHLLAGRCTFTPEGVKTLSLSAGDTLYVPADTRGTWVIEDTVRKVYVIV